MKEFVFNDKNMRKQLQGLGFSVNKKDYQMFKDYLKEYNEFIDECCELDVKEGYSTGRKIEEVLSTEYTEPYDDYEIGQCIEDVYVSFRKVFENNKEKILIDLKED